MNGRLFRTIAATASMGIAATVGGCGGDDSTGPVTNPPFDPANFVTAVTNPYFPLVPGTTYYYEGETEDGEETDSVQVLGDTKTILGVTATVVRDRVYVEGDLVEETFDWYAQDTDGNVWYLGEDSRDIENGQVVGTTGSWEAGVDGAEAGIIMWGDPAAHLGETYRQELAPGVAEDVGKVVALGESVEVPYGSFTGCVETEDRNDLEPDVVENKFYCPQLGLALETAEDERNELVDVATAP